jgi:hypothetical protein
VRAFPPIVRRLGARRSLPLKLDPAVLLDRCLLDSDHLPFHLGQLGGGLLVTADQEGSRPEDDNRGGGRYSILRALAVLCAGESGRPG